MGIKKINDLEMILKDCISNIEKLENISETLFLNRVGSTLNYLKEFNNFIENLKYDYTGEEIKEIMKEANQNSDQFIEYGKDLENKLQDLYLNKLEKSLENVNNYGAFDKFYIYSELGKIYLELEMESKVENIIDQTNLLIKNNSQEILDGYRYKSILTYQDCQFINDILIDSKNNDVKLDLFNLKEKLIELSINDNSYINEGPKDTLLYIESYEKQKTNDKDLNLLEKEL